MTILLNASQSIFSIIIMIGIGYTLSARGWFNEDTSKLFSRIIVGLALPALMISNIMDTFTREGLSQAGIGLLIPPISITTSFLISIVIAKLNKIKPERKGTFQCMFFLSNTMFIGLPVNLALFGEASVPYVLYYYFSNTTFLWTLGVYLIRKDSGLNNESIFSLDALKKIFSPPLIAFIIAIIFIMLGVELPKFVMDTCKYIGNLTTPLSMFFIGIVIKSVDLSNFKFDKDMLWVIVGRFIISPLLIYTISLTLSAPSMMRNVFVIQSALPIMTNMVILTKAYNGDFEYAAVMTVLTTLASLVFIPIYRFLLG
jgi:predicted permease